MSRRLLLLLAAVAVVGCGDEKKTSSAVGGRPPEAAPAKADAARAPADVPRKIIYTAAVELAVEDLDPVTAKARELVAGWKGYVAKADVTGRANGRRTGTLTVRVPAERFADAVAAFAGLGVVTKSATDSQDVTEEFIDVEARLRNYKAEEAALNKLLESAAGRLEDVLKIREQVVRNRAEIERVEGRLKYLTSQTDLSTVTLTVREEREYTPPAVRTFGGRIGDTFQRSLDGMQRAGENAVLAAVAFAPWLPLVVVGLLVLRWAVRRQSRRVKTRPTSTAAPPPAGGGPSGRT